MEVGVFRGDTTEKLLELAAANGNVVHGIDPMPSPRLDLESFRARHGEHFVFYGEASLAALPRIRDAEAVLIDGDHNWYTVYKELEAVARVAAEERPFPLTLLHDVDWHYGRRDMYYDPDAIPSEYRYPFRKAGMLPGVSELVEEDGINRRFNNAVAEGTPRNGVRHRDRGLSRRGSRAPLVQERERLLRARNNRRRGRR